MNDESLDLLREIVISVQSAGNSADDCFALRITCKSGAKYEVEAAISSPEPKNEILEVAVRRTIEFHELKQWPEGPEIRWFERKEISDPLSVSPIESVSMKYADQGYLDGLPVPGRSEIRYKNTTGVSLVLSHLDTPGIIGVRIDY